MRVNLIIFFMATCIVKCIVGPPLEKQKPPEAANNQTEQLDLGIKYERYLREVIQALESDDKFRQKLETANVEDIKTGKIAEELQFVNHNVRSQLDELKREEMNRLRKYARQHQELSNGMNRNFVAPPDHLDARNPHTFEIHDLERLMVQTTRDLEEADRRRRDEFKTYEMEKEHERREKLKALSEEEQKKLQMQYDEMQKKHKEHPKLHHPGSKQQLADVWEEKDRMQREDFNPKTFFLLHDIDSNGYWSPEEVSALFQNELDKLYERGLPEDDMAERYEEMQRMREHVYNETDSNRDGLISLDEFMGLAQSRDFNNDPGWEGLDEQQIYSQQEYEAFERHREQMMHHGQPIYSPNSIDPRVQYQQAPQFQQHPQQPRYPQGQGYNQPDHGMHPQVVGQYGNMQYQQPNAHVQPSGYNFQPQQFQQHQFQAGLGPHESVIQQQQKQYQNMVQQQQGSPQYQQQQYGGPQHPQVVQQQQQGGQPQVVQQQGSPQHPQVVQHQQQGGQQPQVVQQQGGQQPQVVQQPGGQQPQVVQQQGGQPQVVQQQGGQQPQVMQQGSQGKPAQPPASSQQAPDQKPVVAQADPNLKPNALH